MAPAGTPAPIVAKLNAEIQKILATPVAQEQLLLQGAYAIRMTPEQSGERIRQGDRAVGEGDRRGEDQGGLKLD